MKNKFLILIIVLIIAILGLSALLSPYNSKITSKLSNNNTINNSSASQNNSVIAILEGPKSAEEGKNIQIIWKITNNLNVSISNVQGVDQNEFFNFGRINPGETKTYSFFMEVPSLNDIKNDFGLNATISDPFYIDSFQVKYFVDEVEFNINSNTLEINLV
jgi:hypothetical protein